MRSLSPRSMPTPFYLPTLSILATTEATYFADRRITLAPFVLVSLKLPAFIGCLLGTIWDGLLGNCKRPVPCPMLCISGRYTELVFATGSIVWFTKRSNGMYEPEFGLYHAVFPALVGPAGRFLYGCSTTAVRHTFEQCCTADLCKQKS